MRSAEAIAVCALDHYKKTLTRGKPKADTEWTVYAAIVAERSIGDARSVLWVVSCATGTKCTTHRVQGQVVQDCHAEVLSRRGLMRVLWMEILGQSPSERHHNNLLEPSRDNDGKFQLRSDTRLHLYISCSPCGDASIYPITEDQVMLHTGAKVIVSHESGVDVTTCGGVNQLLQGTTVAREKVQSLGKLRTKSGRSNLPAHLRSTSMSCSDKIVQWSIMGLQGGLLSGFIGPPITLSSVVVSRDPRIGENTSAQDDALKRAIPDRVHAICMEMKTARSGRWEICAPSVSVVSKEFASDRAAMEFKTRKSTTEGDEPSRSDKDSSASDRKRKRSEIAKAVLSPCGISLNWQFFDPTFTELLVGARGIRQGKKPKSDQDYQNLASRLSRKNFSSLARASNPPNDTGLSPITTYQQLKRALANPEWLELKSRILRSETLAGWLRSGEEADFLLVAESDSE